MISILKDTENISDEETLEKLSAKYDFLYIHPVRFFLLNVSLLNKDDTHF